MSYKIKPVNDQLYLYLEGTIDLSETSEIKEAIQNEPKSGFKKFLVDGSKIEYIDSSGIALLIYLKRAIPESGMLLEFESLSDSAMKVVSLAGLTSIITPKHPNVSEKKSIETQPEKKDDLSDLELDMLFDEPLQSAKVTGSNSTSAGKNSDLNDFEIKPSDFN
jgi:anti-sigma B factor antagonist